MRVFPVVLGMLVIGTFLVAMAPTTAAAAYCVQNVKEPIPEDRCDGFVCYGWNQQVGWQYCVPNLCAFQTDCCYYTPDGHAFYCP